jgi:HK97 family phage major capsid protein
MPTELDLTKYEAVSVKTGIHYRNAEIAVRAEADGVKVYDFACSSEAPVENRWIYSEEQDRYFYGTEVLLHGIENVDMGWIGSGNAPFLKDHDRDDQVAVILGASLENRQLFVNGLKFSRSMDAVDIQNDIDDGIRKNVSIGYVILEAVEVQAPRGNSAGVYHVTKWKPYEVSSVSIPAVDSVGFGRSKEQDFDVVLYRLKSENTNNKQGVRVMGLEEKEIGGNQAPAENVIAMREHSAEVERIEAIKGIADVNSGIFPAGGELAARAIAEKVSVKEFFEKRFQPAILEEQKRQATVQIDMTDKDKQRFSVVRLLEAQVCRQLGVKGPDAKFEEEICQEYSEKRGIKAQRDGVILPYQAIPMTSRAAIVSSGTGAGVVQEFHSGEVIEYLRAEAVLGRAGARFISGLVGKFDMAKIGVGATSYWVGEKIETGADVTTSALDLDLLQFAIRTVATNQGITRQMLKQTSIDVEAIVRGELFAAIGDAIDLAGLAGTTVDNAQPTGLMYTTSVGTEALATANTPLWSDIVNMETTVAEANALRGALAYIMHPTNVGLLKQTLKASGVPGFVVDGGMCNGYPVLSSTNAVKATVKENIFGNWNELMVGLWGGIELVVDPFTYSRKGIVSLTAFQECDIQVRHPQSFVYTTNPAA